MKVDPKEQARLAKESLKVDFERKTSDPNLNKEEDQIAHSSSLVILIFALLTPNIFAGIYAVIGLIVLNGTRSTYNNWFRAVKSFYFIAVIFLIIFIIIFIFVLVWGLLKDRTWLWLLGLWVIVLSIIQLIFSIRLYGSMKVLYTPPEGKGEGDKVANYGTAKTDAQA